jgi:serine/threonine-protein kinase HipA
MSVNGKFKVITREDLLAVANRFGIGTAKKVIHEVGEAVSNWMEFARETGVDHNEASKIKSHHIIL